MCGIAGIVGTSPVNQRIYDALTVLQHRGQDAAGIATVSEGELFVRKGPGLVRDVFEQRHMQELKGNMGMGHVRYPTAGCDSAAEAQPFYVNAPYGICLAHNGNLTNARELGEVLEREDRRHLNTTSDSEVLLNVLASELQRVGTPRVTPADIFAALSAVYRRCRGGYAVIAMVIGHGLIGLRDPNGIRPLVLGQRETPKGAEWMLASESVALDMLGFKLVRDVAPGEVVYIDAHGRLHTQVCVSTTRHAPCIFEYVYFARPDSLIDNISVHRARMRMGDRLAEKILRERPDHGIDVVIPIPDTSRTSAMQVAQHLGRQVSRRLRQEPLCRTHVHHARTGAAFEVGAQQAERHRPGISQQECPAGGRLDRARHDLGADHRPGPRGRRAQGVLRLGGTAGEISECLRHRHAGQERTGCKLAQRR